MKTVPGIPRLLAVCALVTVAVAVTPAARGAQGLPPLVLEAIAVQPDEPLVRELVTDLLRVEPGVAVDAASLVQARENLQDSGYFSEVVVYTAPGTRPGRVVLHADVVLDRKPRFVTGLGYEPLDGWYLNLLGVRVRNQPRPGSELRLVWRDGFNTQGLLLAGELPRAGRPGHAWLAEAELYQQTWYVYEGRDHWQQHVGRFQLRAGYRWPLSPALMATVRGGVSGYDPDDTITQWDTEDDEERPASDLIGADLGRGSLVDLWCELAWDRRDPVRPWQRGAWAGTRLRASTDLEGGASFWTGELDARRSFAAGPHRALALRARVAHASGDTPYHLRFPMGGVTTVRGYVINQLSSPYGASSLWHTNIELRVALADREAPLPKLTAVVFLDAGQAWDDGGSDYGFALAAGYGIRFRLPWVQLVGLDIGYPLREIGEDAPFAAHISLGWLY